MGFRCQITGNHVQGSPKRILAATRQKIYPVRHGTEDGKQVVIDNGGEGWEIMKELIVDPSFPQDKIDKYVKLNYK